MDKNALVNKIRSIEGLTSDEKSALIDLLRKQKKYGLVWEDKPEDIEERLRDELPILTEVPERAIISEDKDAPNHILIEGDNLEALTTLSYTHEGKIDVIYIDPPYNTGNKDFVYNDKYVDKEDSYRHSKWLSFMSRRLKIAKKLLAEKGVVFISIDDNEQAQLKLLCDEVFANNFMQQFIIESNPRGSQASKYFANTHEYILCYSKVKNPDINFGINKTDDSQAEYRYEDPIGNYRLLGLRQRGGAWRRSDRPLLFYPIYVNPENGDVSLEKDLLHKIEVKPCRPTGEESRWTWSKEKVRKEKKFLTGIIVNKGTEKEKWDIYRKNYITDDNGEVKKSKVKSIWDDKEINYQNGGTELKIILSDEKFSYPKPVFLLDKIINISSLENSTILDFFAGSGTTLHATMKLNSEDGGHRKCILVTNNENNICEEVTYERNKRVINGYTTPKGDEVEGLKSNTLRYYKTDFISRDQTPRNMRALVVASTDLLCIKNDIYTEKLFAGKKLPVKFARYFEEGERKMLVIYDERVIPFIIELLQSMPLEKEKIMIYLFSPSSYAFDDEFIEVVDKVKLCALPAAIYDAYKKVLPKRKPKFLPEALAEVDGLAHSSLKSEQSFQPELNFDGNGGEL